jgi:hypothetical protein
MEGELGEGAVRLGGASGSIYEAGPVRPAQGFVEPAQVFDDFPPQMQNSFVPQGYAPAFPGDESVGFASTVPIDRPLFRVSNTAFDRLGIPNGFTSFDAFIPVALEGGNALWFVNPRAAVTNSGEGAGSVGFGRRYYNAGEDRVYGMSFWWDWDTAHYGTYHQLGGSFESIGRFFTMRGNFNLPIGDANEFIGVVDGFSNPTFQGSNIGYTRTVLMENAYQQFDLELSTPMPLVGQYGLDVGVGVYYLNGDGDARDGAGFSLRTQAQVTEDFWINGLLTTDPVFGANYSMNMELTIPDGPPSRWFQRKPVASHLTSSVLRNYRVAAKVSQQTSQQLFTSICHNQLLGVAHIDPNAAAGGNGTVESPFASLAEYMALPAAQRAAFDIVFVRANADNSDTDLNTTITLLNGQALYGDGSGQVRFNAQELVAAGVGPLLLPGQTVGSIPLLTNSALPGADVVTLASANEVAHLTIDGTGTGRGIVGTNIDGFNIHDNTIRNVIDGIVITSNTTPVLNCPGENVGIIANNVITGTGQTNPIDPGGIVLTHTAGNLAFQLTGNTVTQFNQFGADITVTGGTLNANDEVGGFFIGNNSFNTNGGGLRMAATGNGRINADIQGNVANNNLNDGFEFSVNGPAAIFNIESFTGNSASQNRGHGVQFLALNNGTMTLDNGIPTSGSVTGTFRQNLLDGMNFTANNATIVIDQISGLNVGDDDLTDAINRGNGDDGLELSAINGGSITVIAPLLSNNFNGNGGTVPGLGNPLPAEVGAGRGNGLEVNTTGAGSIIRLGGVNPAFDGGIGTLDVPNSNNFLSNTGNGIAFALNGGTILVDGIYNNNANGNANGISIVNNLGGTFSAINASLPGQGDIRGNNFSENTNAGMFIGGTGAGGGPRATTNLGLIADNNFNRETTGVEGILFNATDNFITMNLVKNTFVGRLPGTAGPGDPGAGRGIGGRISGTVGTLPPGGLDLTMIDNTFDGSLANTFTNNGDAHVGIIFDGGTDNIVRISGHTFNNAFDGPLTEFNGDGINYIVRNGAVLRGFVKSSEISGNNGNGIFIEALAGQVNDFEIGGLAIGEGNVITNNGLGGLPINQAPLTFHGINIFRRDAGQFNDLLIARNQITQNGLTAAGGVASFANGIFIRSTGSDQVGLANGRPDTVRIEQNILTDNLGDGIEFRVEADADLNVDVINNIISRNGRVGGAIVNNSASGIQVTENANSSADTRAVWGLWQQNTITFNANDGIQLDGDVSDTLTGAQLVIGSPTLNGIGVYDPLGNIITDNGGDGIQMTMGGAVTIGNNIIMRNGTFGPGGTPINAGINIDGNFGNHVGQDVTIVSNLIAENNGDGIEWLEEGQSVGSLNPTRLYVQNNLIQLNRGRGIDLLIRPGDSDTTDSDNLDPNSPGVTGLATGSVAADVSIIDNVVLANDLIGVYIVTTNATDQSQAVNAIAPLSQNGGVTPAYQLRLDIHGNDIVGNGINSQFPATGLVMRVGTTDGGFGPTFAGGFATIGTNNEDLNGDGILDNDLNGDGYLNAAALGLVGGVSASITNNYFDGNLGDDILIHSFRSTVVPGTGTTWTATAFNTAGYQSDPLARLDLIFTDNTFGSIVANNTILNIVPGGEPGAFYNDANGAFKSRTQGTNPEDGPFSSATRRRNATRLASRYNTNVPLAPNPSIPGGSAGFLYPGMGDSTFRVIGGTNTFLDPLVGTVALNQIFLFDNPGIVGNPLLVDAQFEANGVGFTGANLFGELPFGWGTFNPGRTGFTNP